MTSLSDPGTWFGKAKEARSLARMSNEYAAQMARDYPGRFGVLASLSLPDIEGSLTEIAYAYDVLKVDEIAMLTSYGDKWPGDEAFAPVFEELNRRGATVYFHPTSADCCSALCQGRTGAGRRIPCSTRRAPSPACCSVAPCRGGAM